MDSVQVSRSQMPKVNYRMFNLIGPWVLISIYLMTASYGVLVAMPALYTDLYWRRVLQAMSCFCFLQLTAHWFTTRGTSSALTQTGKWTENSSTAYKNRTKNRFDSSLSSHKTSSHDGVIQETTLSATSDSCKSPLNCKTAQSQNGYENSSLENTQHNNGYINAQRVHSQKDIEGNGFNRSPAKQYWENSEGEAKGSSSDHTKLSSNSNEDTQHENAKTNLTSKKYWTWHYCETCKIMAPPRCHHCMLCNECILKRNHHCFLTGVCIGVNNFRYFLVFIFWAVITVTFGLCHMYPYIYYELLPIISPVDFLPAVCLIRGLAGKVPIHMFLLSIIFWGLHLFAGVSYFIFADTVRTLIDGRTKHETDADIQIADCRSMFERLREVLGENWIINFLLPFKRKTQCNEDPITWPGLYIINSKNKTRRKKKKA